MSVQDPTVEKSGSAGVRIPFGLLEDLSSCLRAHTAHTLVATESMGDSAVKPKLSLQFIFTAFILLPLRTIPAISQAVEEDRL